MSEREVSCPQDNGKAVLYRFWTLNPQTGQNDRFCNECTRGEVGSPRLQFQQVNRCPLLSPDEWIDGHREQIGPGGISYLEPDDLCPAHYGRSPAAQEIGQALRWKGDLSVLYPRGIPEIIIEGVEYAEIVRSELEAEGRRLDEIDAEQKRRTLQNG